MIAREEAQRQNLPGSDVFLRTHLAYDDELNRDAFIAFLHREAYKAFMDTFTIGQYPSIKQEEAMLQKDVRNLSTMNTLFGRIEYSNFENLKIAAGFELYLKACLLSNDVVIHIINNISPFKDLSKKQKIEPVYKDELLALEGFYYNGKLNILRGLTSQSLGFDLMLNNTNYRSKLGKTSDFLEIVDDYRKMRNLIHLPGDIVEAPHLNSSPGDTLIRALVNFINTDIVEHNNNLIYKWGLNIAGTLSPLEYF